MHTRLKTRLDAYLQDVSKVCPSCFGSAAWLFLWLCNKGTRLSHLRRWNWRCFVWRMSKPLKWEAFQLLLPFAFDHDCFGSELTTGKEKWVIYWSAGSSEMLFENVENGMAIKGSLKPLKKKKEAEENFIRIDFERLHDGKWKWKCALRLRALLRS